MAHWIGKGRQIAENDGNFRALLRLRMCAGDVVFQQHLESAPRNALYRSKTIQNEALTDMSAMIVNDVMTGLTWQVFGVSLLSLSTGAESERPFLWCPGLLLLLGRLSKVDLIILEGENVRPSVSPSVHKKFLRFE